MSSDMVLTEHGALPEPVNAGRIPADHLPAIAERHRNGESLTAISQEYGVTYQGLRLRLEKWALAGNGDTDHHQLVTEYLVANAIEAKERIVESPNMLSLARAREETKFWCWMLERRRPKLYGVRPEYHNHTAIQVIVQRETPQMAAILTNALPDDSANGESQHG